jgi:hypothetical protein
MAGALPFIKMKMKDYNLRITQVTKARQTQLREKQKWNANNDFGWDDFSMKSPYHPPSLRHTMRRKNKQLS